MNKNFIRKPINDAIVHCRKLGWVFLSRDYTFKFIQISLLCLHYCNRIPTE